MQYTREDAYPSTSYDPYSQQSYYYGQQSGYGQQQQGTDANQGYYYQDQSAYGAYGGYGAYAQAYGMQQHEPGAINTLHASGFPMGTTEQDVGAIFGVQPGFIAMNFQARPGKLPCAWIQFHSTEYAIAAKAQTDGRPLYGKPIRVGYAKSEMKTSRRQLQQMGFETKTYNQNPSQAINTLYITGLSQDTQESQIHDLVRVLDGYQGLSFVAREGRNPHGFVLFRDIPAATAAMQALQTKDILGRPLRVQYAKSEMHKNAATST